MQTLATLRSWQLALAWIYDVLVGKSHDPDRNDARDKKRLHWNVEPVRTITFSYTPTPPTGPTPDDDSKTSKRDRQPRPSRGERKR